jgi:UDP-N-acetylmuramate dehydrogenase
MTSRTPLQIQRDLPLAPWTTLGIGGPARFFARAQSVDEILEALAWVDEQRVPLFILAGGSNVLIADEGFDGLVLQIDLHGVTVESEDRFAMVRVAAGEPWDAFVARAVESRWAGIECLSGIPGSTGATPIQNVGAYGQDVSETIVRVEVLERATRRVRTLTADECRFAYRSSIFKHDEHYIVLSVTFRLTVDGPASVRYPELRTYLETRGESLEDLRHVRDAVIAIRRRKGMVLDPDDTDTRSDGSFFTNPIISAEEYERFLPRARAFVGEDAAVPAFPSRDGTVKLSAAWLIERAGFRKGHVHGNVGLSTKHTLAIVNRGGGMGREVLELVGLIQTRVTEAFGVALQPEPNFVGFGAA